VLFFVRVIFQVWSSAGFYFEIPLDDPTASDYLVFLIEDGGLAGGDGALGLVEEGVDGMVVDAAERGHGRGVAVADRRAAVAAPAGPLLGAAELRERPQTPTPSQSARRMLRLELLPPKPTYNLSSNKKPPGADQQWTTRHSNRRA